MQVEALPGFGYYEQGDAEYAFDFSGFFPFLPNDVDNCPIPSVDIGLAVNDTNNNAAKTPYWGNLQHRAYLYHKHQRHRRAHQRQLPQLHLLRQPGTSDGPDLSPHESASECAAHLHRRQPQPPDISTRDPAISLRQSQCSSRRNKRHTPIRRNLCGGLAFR